MFSEALAIADRNDALDWVDDMHARIAAAQKEVEDLRQVNDLLQQKTNVMQQEKDLLQQKNDFLTSEVTRLQEQIRQLKEQS